MTQFDLKIDEAQIKGLVAEGILSQLTEEGRQNLIKQAIEYLLTPPKSTDRYSTTTPKSPIQEAFENAATWVVRDVVKDIIEKDEAFKTTVNNMVTDTVAAAMDNDYDFQKLVSDAYSEALMNVWKKKNSY